MRWLPAAPTSGCLGLQSKRSRLHAGCSALWVWRWPWKSFCFVSATVAVKFDLDIIDWLLMGWPGRFLIKFCRSVVVLFRVYQRTYDLSATEQNSLWAVCYWKDPVFLIGSMNKVTANVLKLTRVINLRGRDADEMELLVKFLALL